MSTKVDLYNVSFIDDHSRFTWVYLMSHKSDFFCIVAPFTLWFNHNFMLPKKILHSGLAGEYELADLLNACGTIH